MNVESSVIAFTFTWFFWYAGAYGYCSIPARNVSRCPMLTSIQSTSTNEFSIINFSRCFSLHIISSTRIATKHTHTNTRWRTHKEDIEQFMWQRKKTTYYGYAAHTKLMEGFSVFNKHTINYYIANFSRVLIIHERAHILIMIIIPSMAKCFINMRVILYDVHIIFMEM